MIISVHTDARSYCGEVPTVDRREPLAILQIRRDDEAGSVARWLDTGRDDARWGDDLRADARGAQCSVGPGKNGHPRTPPPSLRGSRRQNDRVPAAPTGPVGGFGDTVRWEMVLLRQDNVSGRGAQEPLERLPRGRVGGHNTEGVARGILLLRLLRAVSRRPGSPEPRDLGAFVTGPIRVAPVGIGGSRVLSLADSEIFLVGEARSAGAAMFGDLAIVGNGGGAYASRDPSGGTAASKGCSTPRAAGVYRKSASATMTSLPDATSCPDDAAPYHQNPRLAAVQGCTQAGAYVPTQTSTKRPMKMVITRRVMSPP